MIKPPSHQATKSPVNGRICLFICVFVSLYSFACFAKDINFEVTVDKTKVSLGSSIQLKLTLFGTQDFAVPDLPDIENFDWRYLGPETSISIVNSQVSTSITHSYRLIPLKEGRSIIPSISVNYQGKDYTSEPIKVEVVRGPLGPSDTPDEPAETFHLEDRVFLVMEAAKDKAYVNELIPVTIKLFINNLSIRDIQYPEFDHAGFSSEKTTYRKYRQVMGGITYDVIEFTTSVFALRPGELSLGPARLGCNLIVTKQSKRTSRFPFFDDEFFGDDIFDSFFRRYETYSLNLHSESLPLTIVPLPAEGKPSGFTGAIGNYNFELEVGPRELKAGDPITLRMLISGEGNFRTVESPVFKAGNDFKVYEPEIKQGSSSKLFEHVVIPTRETVSSIPEISFSFFDPSAQSYQTITRGPVPITVNPLPEGEELKVFEASPDIAVVGRKEILGKDIIYIKDSPGAFRRKGSFLCKNRLFIVLQMIPLLALILVFVFQKRKERLISDVRYARRLQAPRKARKNLGQARRFFEQHNIAQFYKAVFKTLQEYIGDKFHLPAAGLTSDVVDELKKQGLNDEVLAAIKMCFDECDSARYAPASITRENMVKVYRLLTQIIDTLERMRL
jgi:hypothetical protein